MIIRILLSASYLVIILSARTLDVPAAPSSDGKALQIDLNEEHSVELLQHWMDQAMSGLMAAVATDKLGNAPQHVKEHHEECSKNATSVPDHAKCIVRLIDIHKEGFNSNKNEVMKDNKEMKKKTKGRRVKKAKGNVKSKGIKTKKEKKRIVEKMPNPDESKWVGSFMMRAKREVVSRSTYTLPSTNESPFAILAKSLTNTVRQIKRKDGKQHKSWKNVIGEVQEEAKKLKARKLIKKMFARRLAMVQEDKDDDQKVDPRRPLAMKDLDVVDDDDPKALIAEARKAMANMTDDEKVMREPLKLMREAIRLGMMASGKNVSDFEDKTLKLFSPRIMSVLPEEDDDDTVNLLSPSLFSLHKEGKGIEKLTNLADGFGFAQGKDHEEWLNFVMEAAGVTDVVEYLKDEKIKKASGGLGPDEEEMRTPSGQPLYFTKKNVSELYGEKEEKKIDVFDALQNTYTHEQAEETKNKGYSIMTRDQLQLIYGPGSPYEDEERLKTLSSIPDNELPSHIEDNIRAVAEMKKFEVRKKDTVLSPVVGMPLVFQSTLLSAPVVLSPLVFSPSILSPAVLGPVILGPWVFIPVILSPRVLSPLILNPLIFSPIVLSPLVLHPLILSPGVFNPFVLSPLVLSPFILSPQVFTPLILTPMVLNPVILTPMVGSPLVLSPFVLSPLILSPQVLFAVVLSPYALSPLIESKLLLSEVVLSPSWLS